MTTAKHRLWTKKVKNAIRKDSVFDWGVQGSGLAYGARRPLITC